MIDAPLPMVMQYTQLVIKEFNSPGNLFLIKVVSDFGGNPPLSNKHANAASTTSPIRSSTYTRGR